MRPATFEGVQGFRRRLLRWYEVNRRELPWRGISDPYRIWVSEIMLQQTRVAAALGYYERFLGRFPDVRSLAKAREAAVLAAWSGLGYYRRARMLHRAAREIVRKRGGRFPQSAAEWRELPGIGRYTAAAIASIACGEAVAVVDGNVERVLRRLTGSAQPRAAGLTKSYWELAEALLSRERPGDFNQAMMELGATVCLPGEPHCGECPVARWCGSYPLRRGPNAPARRQRYSRRDASGTDGGTPAVQPEGRRKAQAGYALALQDDRVRLRRRPANQRLMPNMWELPAAKVNGAAPVAVLRHSITTTDYRVLIFQRASRQGEWVAFHRLATIPLTGLTRKILRHFRVIQ